MTEIYFGIKTFITGQEEIKSKGRRGRAGGNKSKGKVTISQDDLQKSDN